LPWLRSVSGTSNPRIHRRRRRSFVIPISAQIAARNAAQTRYRRAAERLSEASFFCSPAAVRSLAGCSLGELSDAMTGKRGFWRARSSLSGVGMEPSANVVLRDVGCPEELTSPVSFPVPAGISKSGASPFGSCRQNHVGKAVIAPTIRGRPQWRSGALADPRRLARQCPGPNPHVHFGAG
jgi:hypothetical protein